MAISFQHAPSPHIQSRRSAGPPQTSDVPSGFNNRFALVLTRVVGTMWCAYAFAILALFALPSALASGSLLPNITWLSQTFIQLVMLSVIMVGQNVLGRASDKRAEMTYEDAGAAFHETEQIQRHLAAQDEAINQLLQTVIALEARLRTSTPGSAEPDARA
jgi:hypothetical protein